MFQDSPQHNPAFTPEVSLPLRGFDKASSDLQELLNQVQSFVPDSIEFSEVIAESGVLAEAIIPEILQWVSRYLTDTDEKEIDFRDFSLAQASVSWVVLYERLESHLPEASLPESVVLAEIFFVASKVANAVAAELRSFSSVAPLSTEVSNHSFSQIQLEQAQQRIDRRSQTGEEVVDILLECNIDPGEYATLMIEEAGALVGVLSHRTFLKGVLLKAGPIILQHASRLAEELQKRVEQERRLAGRVCTLVELAENRPYDECAQVVFRSLENFLVPSLRRYIERSSDVPLEIVLTYFRDIDTEQIAYSSICNDPIRELRDSVGDSFRPSLLITALNRRGIFSLCGTNWGRYPLSSEDPEGTGRIPELLNQEMGDTLLGSLRQGMERMRTDRTISLCLFNIIASVIGHIGRSFDHLPSEPVIQASSTRSILDIQLPPAHHPGYIESARALLDCWRFPPSILDNEEFPNELALCEAPHTLEPVLKSLPNHFDPQIFYQELAIQWLAEQKAYASRYGHTPDRLSLELSHEFQEMFSSDEVIRNTRMEWMGRKLVEPSNWDLVIRPQFISHTARSLVALKQLNHNSCAFNFSDDIKHWVEVVVEWAVPEEPIMALEPREDSFFIHLPDPFAQYVGLTERGKALAMQSLLSIVQSALSDRYRNGENTPFMKELRRHHDPLDPFTLSKRQTLAHLVGSLVLHRDLTLRAAAILKRQQAVERYLRQEGCYTKDYGMCWGYQYRPETLFGKSWREEDVPSLELSPVAASIISLEQRELAKYLS